MTSPSGAIVPDFSSLPPEADEQARMAALIDMLSAYIEQFHGGLLELVSFDGEVLRVSMAGNCRGCRLSAVTLHGCHVGDESLIGIGAIVMNRVRIGAHCIVGAGALVTEGKEYPDGVLIVGSPARVIRELTAAEIAGLAESARRYSERAQLYRRALRPA